MDFGDAIRALKRGERVTRHGWGNDYIWLMPWAMVDADWCREPGLKKLAEDAGGNIQCFGTIRMLTHDSHGVRGILTGWLASQVDILAEDWEIYICDELLQMTIEQIVDRVDCEKILDKNFRSEEIQTLYHKIRTMRGFYVSYERIEKTALEIADKKYRKAMEKI